MSNVSTAQLLKNAQEMATYFTQGQIITADVKKSFQIFLGSGHFKGYDTKSCRQLVDKALIKNVEEITKKLQPEVRKGSKLDVDDLSDTFAAFGYDVRVHENLTAQKLRQTLKNLSEEKNSNGKSIFKNYASLVVCLLSHGGLGTVYGTDYKAVNVLELQYEIFNSETCPDLNDKPKIFIIQACQGEIGQRMIIHEPDNVDDEVRENSSTYSPLLKSGN